MSGHTKETTGRARLVALLGIAVLVGTVAVASAGPNLPQVTQADFPNDDAVILRHRQSWSLETDGRVTLEEHRFVKLLNDRAWGRYADPRVDVLEGRERSELISAVAHLPDGTVVELPEYSTTEVTPVNVSNWPAFADWRQKVYVTSGIQNDAILEFHYKRTSKPGVRCWLEADLRIGDVDPVVERVVEVTLSAGQKLQTEATGALASSKYLKYTTEESGSRALHRWVIRNVPSQPDEPHALPWRERVGRLRFTNCSSTQAWVAELVKTVEAAAQPDDAIREFVEEAAKDEVDDAGRVRAALAKLRATFNFVNDHLCWVGRNVRPAAEVFDSCYGSRLESAAVTLAAVRALGIDARLWVAVDGDTFSQEVATDTDLVGLVIQPGAAGEPFWIDAAHGVINPNRDWRDRLLLTDNSGKLDSVAAFASPRSQPDWANVRGQLALDEKGEKLTGSLSLELTGLFVDPEKLRDEKAKKSQIEAIVGHVLPDLKVTDYSVSHLSTDRFVALADVESAEELGTVFERRMVMLAEETPVLAEAGLPVGPSTRHTAIAVPGPMSGDLRLTVKLPEGWNAVILPEPLHAVSGNGFRIGQQITAEEGLIRIVRQVSLETRAIQPGDYAAVREAVRSLRNEACRTIVIEQAGS